ncbi:hypothetical protein CEXT_263981 [Caerostris extrusa]|uniref:Secreted protein n=1 Tax=Caerostris extrusa TaxID=172846 RepID=A0AAV4M8I9_CAEEX|nr:hypothetical protein CEXT_263981 [Caerostris extrusa]
MFFRLLRIATFFFLLIPVKDISPSYSFSRRGWKALRAPFPIYSYPHHLYRNRYISVPIDIPPLFFFALGISKGEQNEIFKYERHLVFRSALEKTSEDGRRSERRKRTHCTATEYASKMKFPFP